VEERKKVNQANHQRGGKEKGGNKKLFRGEHLGPGRKRKKSDAASKAIGQQWESKIVTAGPSGGHRLCGGGDSAINHSLEGERGENLEKSKEQEFTPKREPV